MKLPPNIERVTLSHEFEGTTSYPPLGFHPFFEHQLGNGDTFGLYWPIGGEQEEPIVAEVWHDEWRLVPGFSCLDTFLDTTRALDDEGRPETPSIADDPRSPLACLNAAQVELRAQRVESAIVLLETAVDVLPEFTEALSALGAQYIRLRRYSEACEVAVQAIIAPPCLGARPMKLLKWLAAQQNVPPSLAEDPIWCIRHQLGLGFGGAKENADCPLLLGAIERYIEQGRIQKALTLMQTYSELMSYETVSFQERYGFDQREFRMRQLEISSRLPGGARKLKRGCE